MVNGNVDGDGVILLILFFMFMCLCLFPVSWGSICKATKTKKDSYSRKRLAGLVQIKKLCKVNKNF